MSPAPSYDERLSVPLRWWALATMFLASVLVAFLVALPLVVAVGLSAFLLVLVAALFIGYGAARVCVRDGVLSAGRARIAVTHLGPAQQLDAEGTRALAGRDADARAYLLIRPYVSTSVRVDLTDPADPTPYWLIASRHPERLLAALHEAIGHTRLQASPDPGWVEDDHRREAERDA